MQWFRMWADAVDDEKLKLLSPGDRWYFIGLLCCKASGILDKGDADELLRRKLTVKLDLTLPELEELRRRLSEVELVVDGFQPKRWDKRQYVSDRGMPEGESRKNQRGYIYFIGGKSGPVKIGYSRNPWARVKDITTSNHERMELLGTVRTNDVSERKIHELLKNYRSNGEWFERRGLVSKILLSLNEGISTDSELYDTVEKLRSNDVATTENLRTATTETESDTEKNSVRADPSDPPSLDATLFAEARNVFGRSTGGMINTAIRAKGKPWLLDLIERCRGKDPEAARAYLAAAMKPKERKLVV